MIYNIIDISDSMASSENVCSAETLAESDQMKAEANEKFKEAKYDKAIELYTKVYSIFEIRSLYNFCNIRLFYVTDSCNFFSV